MQLGTSDFDRQDAREKLTDALALLDAYEREQQVDPNAYALLEVARVYCELSARALQPKPIVVLPMRES